MLDREYESKEIFSIKGSSVSESIAKFQNLPETQRAKINLLRGHMPFGLHKFLPGQSVYITILRHPIDRIISHYYFVLRTPNHYLHDIVTSQEMSLSTFVSSGISTELNNGQTRMLAGITNDDFGECPKEWLDFAKDNLHNHFAVVGLVERFDETALLLKKVLNWQNSPFYVKKRVATGRLAVRDIPEETTNVLAEYNQLDCELYEFAQHHFRKTLAHYGLTAMELKRFRIRNRLHTLYNSTKLILKKNGLRISERVQ